MKKLLTLVAFSVLLLVPVGAQNAFAHGTIDQSNVTPSNVLVAISNPNQPLQIGQIFTPTVDRLDGIDVEIVSLGLTGIQPIHVNVHQNTVTFGGGPIVNRATTMNVPPTCTPLVLANACKVHIEFSPPIQLIPGQPHILELLDFDADPTTSNDYVTTGNTGDPYAGGFLLSSVTTNKNIDNFFVTYFLSSQAVGGKLILPGELKSIQLLLERVDIVHTDDLDIDGEVMTVLELPGPTVIELLTLQGGILTALGICDLDVGFITQIRLVTTDATITFNGKVFSLKIPSGVLKFNGVLSVPANEDAVFGFDAEKSVIFTPAGFQLKSPIKFVTTNADC